MPTIKKVLLHPYQIPLLTSFDTAHQQLATRTGAIIEIHTDTNIVGIGEIAPLPEFAGGSMQDVLACLPRLAKHLLDKQLPEAKMNLQNEFNKTSSTAIPSAAIYGIETALLDIQGQFEQCSLSAILSQTSGSSQQEGSNDHLWVAGNPKGPAPTPRLPLSLRGTGAKEGSNDHLWVAGNPKGPTPAPHHPLSLRGRSEMEVDRAIRSAICVNTVIGAMTTESAVIQAQEAVIAGFSCIKLKLGYDDPDAEVARVAAVREAIGSSIDLRLDANEGWTREQARSILTRCADFDIQYVEQPLVRHDLAGMCSLRQVVPIPIAADEMLSDLASARRVLAAQAADIFIIKPQLAGGLYAAQRMLQLANEHGIKCVITSSIEAGIGIAAALHLAASAPKVTLTCGLGTLPMLENDLIYGALPIYKGCIQVPTMPGLGVELDREALKTFSVVK